MIMEILTEYWQLFLNEVFVNEKQRQVKQYKFKQKNPNHFRMSMLSLIKVQLTQLHPKPK